MQPRSISAASLLKHLGVWRELGSGGPAYRQLADRLRLLILDGRLPLGARLPGEREIAHVLGVSRTTTAAAFAHLRDGGLLQSRPGSGVRTCLPSGTATRPSATTDGEYGLDPIDMVAASLPAGRDVHAAYAAALERLPAYLPTFGYNAVGMEELREVVAQRYDARGLQTSPDQIMITSGALHGLAVLLRTLTNPGDRVVIDHPTFPRAIDAIQQAGCRPLPVALPIAGWDVEGIVAAFRQGGPRLAYLIPDFQNPTGRCMGQVSRADLAKAARAARVTLIFDEALSDLGLDEEPPVIDPDAEADVVRLGSTGKSFWGGLRIGWIRADAGMIMRLAVARTSIDLGTPALEQLAAAHLLRTEGGLFERRDTLREQRSSLLNAVRRRLPDWNVATPSGGLCVWAELPSAISTTLAASADRYGVRLAAGPRFGVDGAFERFVRLPFTHPANATEQAIERLAFAYHSIAESARPAPRHKQILV